MKKSILIMLVLAFLTLGLWGCVVASESEAIEIGVEAVLENGVAEVGEEEAVVNARAEALLTDVTRTVVSEFSLADIEEDDRTIAFIQQHAFLFFSPTSLNDLEEDADVIVSGRILPGSVNILTYIDSATSPVGGTLTEIEVLQVFAGDVVEGETLLIAEDYFIMETPYEIQIFTMEDYRPSIIGQEYVFFLIGRENDRRDIFDQHSVIYNISGMTHGRFPVLEELVPSARSRMGFHTVNNFTDTDLGLAFGGDSRRYRSIFQEVVERYFVKIER